MSATEKKVFVIGATGLVGRQAVLALLDDRTVARVVAIVRRPFDVEHPKLEARIVDFDSLETALAGEALDVAICCLGTTMKQARSKAVFRRVDHDYVLDFARAAKESGAAHFIVVTAIGADARSFAFYNRVKGEVEDALTALAFPALTIARPSLLIGERSELRWGEKLAAPFSRFLPPRIRGIEGRTVGRALAKLAAGEARGRRIVASEELARLGA